ncbi:MAG: PAS domain S-box protein [Desulfobacteraceae bacterium]|nr:PAS domain S-box protein [Desulfobacteraceae bacterium]
MKHTSDDHLIITNSSRIQSLTDENRVLRREIRTAQNASEITAEFVVRQFEETEKLLRRFQAANAQRKAVLDSASQIAIIATERNGIITVFNTGAENLLGYSAEEMIGKHTPLIIHSESELAEHSKKLSAECGRRIEGIDIFFEYAARNNSEYEWTFIRKDKTRFPVSVSVNILKGPDGIFTGFLGIATDISEKKRSEKKIHESERKYRLLIDNLPNIVYKGSPDGSLEFFDNKIETLTGYTKEELLSRNIKPADLTTGEESGYAKNIQHALNGDRSYVSEYAIRRKNGDIAWVEERGQIVCDEKGKIEFITGSLLDITERKLAEKALKESDEKYRSLFISGPNATFVTDRDTLEIFDANPVAEDIYGYTRKEMIGLSCTVLCTYENNGKCPGYCKKNGIPGENAETGKIRHYKKDGKLFYVKIKTSPAKYNERQAVILAVTDITEMVEKDTQLIQANKMTALGRMSACVAHELTQPLTAVKMGSEYLKMVIKRGKDISEQDLLPVIGQFDDQVDRGSAIINRLRAFGRKPDFVKEIIQININKCVRDVVGIINQQLRQHNIQVELDLYENLPFIHFRDNLMDQVLFNLLTNARDAIMQKKETDNEKNYRHTIAIRTLTENTRVAVTVSDTGIGIPEHAKDKIFEPFYTTKEADKGMGLGLSIIYGIIKDFNGKVDIQSEEGKSTTFKLTFPYT